jgi:hypothetical protein
MADEAGTTTTETTATTATTGTETKVAETTQATETKATETTEAKGTETKTEETKAAETKAEPVDYAKALSEVPLPEGYTLDPTQTKLGIEAFAKHNLSAEAVKDLVSLYAQQQKAGADGNAKAFADQVTGWKADAEKGSTAEERGTAKEAALKIFGKDEMALLETFGVTNRLGFIKSLAKIGKAIKDDPFVPGNAGAANGSGDARKAFPKSNMNP